MKGNVVLAAIKNILTKGNYMKFKKIDPVNPITGPLKLINLYQKPFIGVLKHIGQSKYSKLYKFETSDGEIDILGSKSFDSFISEPLIGKTLCIECIEIKQTSSGDDYGIASVSVGENDTY